MTLLPRRLLTLAHDVFMAALAFSGAMFLRYGDRLTEQAAAPWLWSLGLFTLTAAVVFAFSRLSRSVWRYASLDDLKRIVRLASIVVLIFLPLSFSVTRLEGVPRSVPAIAWLLLIFLMGGMRFLVRILKEGRSELLAQTAGPRVPVLLLGSGVEAEGFIRAVQQNAQSPYHILGILDRKGKQVGRQIRGIDVLGTIDDLAGIVENMKARGLAPAKLVLSRSAGQLTDNAESLLDSARRLGLTLSRVPPMAMLSAASTDALTVQPVQLEDLLNRPEIVLDQAAIAALIRGRRVLVTGAGGTIGHELCRQIAALGPARLILFEQGEFNLYTADLALREAYAGLSLRSVLGDVCDSLQLAKLFLEERPDLVFHAAAYKHVPLGEDNPCATLETNVCGTIAVAEAAAAAGASAMVLISTDKAVNPSNIMGASKRIAEVYCQARDNKGEATRFITVRFGNVIGSTGSVIPRFQEQLARGGPLTVTHPDITRYFMTVREAVELVLQASAFATGAEAAGSRGHILVLDMGAPVKIMEVARQLIRLSGLTPDADVRITVTGLRAGEKLHEELFRPQEKRVRASAGGIQIAVAASEEIESLEQRLGELLSSIRSHAEDQALRQAVKAIVPEYQWTEAAPQNLAAPSLKTNAG